VRSITLVTLLVVSPAMAMADPAEGIDPQLATSERSDWVIQVTPYIWAAALKGDVSPFQRGPEVSVEKSFSDIMDSLNMAGFINLWGRQGNWIISGDIMFVDTTNSRTTGPLPALPGVPAGLTVKGELDSKQFSATLQGGYRFHDANGITVDALAGARYWNISNRLNVAAAGRSVEFEESFDWFDPIVGARIFVPINDEWSFQAQGDIGGFGVGSDKTWSLLATVNWIVTDRASISAGYKVLDVDYSDDGHVFDTQLRGPVIGATWRF